MREVELGIIDVIVVDAIGDMRYVKIEVAYPTHREDGTFGM